jgi:hypothetical protein
MFIKKALKQNLKYEREQLKQQIEAAVAGRIGSH